MSREKGRRSDDAGPSKKQTAKRVEFVRDAVVKPPKSKEPEGQRSLQYVLIDGSSNGLPPVPSEIQLSEPQLHSTLNIAQNIAKVKNVKCQKAKGNLQPKSNFKPKALKQINIPFEEQVFKGLIDLSVRDEDVGISQNIPKPREVTKSKDPEPVLSDYFTPRFDSEYIVKNPPPLYDIEKVWTYDGFSVSSALDKWEHFEQ